VKAKPSARIWRRSHCSNTSEPEIAVLYWRLPLQICVAQISHVMAGILLAASVFTGPASGAPLSDGDFGKLATACGSQIEQGTLRAVATIESHFDPLALRDNTTHEAFYPADLPAAINLAEDRLTRRHSVDIGLMQINSGNLKSLDLRLEDAFDACRSIGAATSILREAYRAGGTETEKQAALLIALSRYNSGKPLTGVANGYANSVLAARRVPDRAEKAFPSATDAAPNWNVWSTVGAEPTSWVVTADESSEIKRAGAQTSDARSEGRAPASSSEKGEPYEVSAYRESEASLR
jgi:type IV secretion system protein VirB1